MMRLHKTTALALLMGAGMVLAGPAYADAQKNPRTQAGAQGAAQAAAENACWGQLASFDRNRDRRLAADEIAGNEEVIFRAADLDRDGTVTAQEFMRCISVADGDRDAVLQAFVVFDTDRDERLTREEFAAQGAVQRAKILVEQQPARIHVEQRQPTINVEQKPPQVTVTQPPPEVTIQQAEPKVTIEQAEPKVSVQQAEPRVRVEQQGQPRVQVEQPREPRVNVEREAGAQQRAATEQERRATDRSAAASARGNRTGAASAGALSSVSVQELIGRDVVNARGEQVADIDDVVIGRQDQARYVILSVGGFLGMGDKKVAVPFDELRMGENNVILMSERTESELKDLPRYREGDYMPAR